MKTLLLFQIIGEHHYPLFLELDGDYSRFNKVFINEHIDLDDDSDLIYTLQKELCDLIYDENGNYKVTFTDSPTKDWDVFVSCGFLL